MRAFIVAVLAMLVGACGGNEGLDSALLPPKFPQPGQPVRDRVCVNTHMDYNGTPYENVARIRAELDYLGSRCIRDRLHPDSFRWVARRYNRLGRQVILIIGGYFETAVWENNEARAVARARARVDRVIAFEGWNEPWCRDSAAFRANARRLRGHMNRIRAAVGRGPEDVYTVSACSPDLWDAMTRGGVPRQVNTLHSYYRPGQWPRVSPASSAYTLDWWIANSRLGSRKRFATTETGADLDDLGGDQRTHARYDLIHVLNHLYRGVERVALYQLIDDNDEDSFGLWSAHGQPRQAARAIHNLLATVGDARANAPTGFTYSVDDPAGTTLHLPMRHPGGEHYIALWNTGPTAKRKVTIDLSVARSAAIVRPMDSATTEPRATAASHTFSAGDDPVVVRIDPSETGPTGR